MTGKADAVIERLMQLHPMGFDFTLDRIRDLLEKLGNPHSKLPPVIHVAGTNGKGSATAFSRALLEAGGFGVHVHTSPHLVNWHERYRLASPNGSKFVSDDVLAEAVERVERANGDSPITVFKIMTAVAFVLFSEHPADAVIMEVGLGGKLDATNVIVDPAVSLIMPVSIDHQAFLGDSIELIAAEKAGIIKQDCPVVIGFQPFAAAREVLISTAERLDCPLSIYGQDFLAYEEHGRMVFQNERGLIDLPLPRLPGRHQLANAAAAIEAVQMAGFTITEKAIEKAMMVVDWPARMQRLTHGKLVDLAPAASEIWLDGGHNPGAGLVISEALGELEERSTRPLFLITGMIKDKDPVGYFEAFAGLARHVFTVSIKSNDKTIPNTELAVSAQKAGLSAEPVHSVENALKILRDTWPHDEAPPRILIGGSLYLAGEVLRDNGTPPV